MPASSELNLYLRQENKGTKAFPDPLLLENGDLKLNKSLFKWKLAFNNFLHTGSNKTGLTQPLSDNTATEPAYRLEWVSIWEFSQKVFCFVKDSLKKDKPESASIWADTNRIEYAESI